MFGSFYQWGEDPGERGLITTVRSPERQAEVRARPGQKQGQVLPSTVTEG